MRTIVVFETGAALAYAELSDFAVQPQPGYVLEHMGAAYTVTEAWMSPMVHENNGDKKRTGFAKLFAIVSRLYPGKPGQVAEVIAKMESIGTGERPQKSPGGIEIPGKGGLPQFDDVLFLRTKASGRPSTKVLDTSFQAMQLFAARGEEHACACGVPCTSGENIVLTDAAAGEPPRTARSFRSR